MKACSIVVLVAMICVASPRVHAQTSALTGHAPGSGFKLYEGDGGAINFRVYTYVRYLNQRMLDDSYTDSFGTERSVDLRQDIQFNKVTLYWYGWFLDPKFRYMTYVWSANTSQGLFTQVVVAGNLRYAFSKYITLGGGVEALPGVRSTTGNFPNWLGVDNRLIADEYFRPSYTSGIWIDGVLRDNLSYKVMLGDNLSQLGVDAAQLDNKLDTWSGEIAWTPGGDYGRGFGDFERHENTVGRIGGHFTYSTESRQNQPGENAPENAQIRISDGNIVFAPGLFGTGINIIDVVYHMVSIDAGIKHRGLALEGEYYWRWVNGIRGDNVDQLTFDDLKDDGFQLQASAMLKPETLQLYLSGSMIFGEYGDPSDARLGANWYPWRNKSVRWNNEFILLDHSPVGALSLPYVVGGNGTLFHSNLEVNF